MTVSTLDSKQQFIGDGATTSFAVTYKVLAESDIEVFFDSTQQLSGFTVTLNADQETTPGATIDFAVAPDVDVVISFVRTMALLQGTDYPPFDPFPAESHETALDRLTLIAQQLLELIERAPVPPPDSTGDDVLVGGDLTVQGELNVQSGATNLGPATVAGVLTALDKVTSALAPTNPEDLTRKDYVDNAVNNALILDSFVGTVHGFAGTPLTGAYWSIADGRALSRTTYSKLFSVIGTQYGDGNGSTTFNVPDYRGYFLRFENMGGGIDPDAASRTDRGDGIGGDNVGSIQSFALENIIGSLTRFHGGFIGSSGVFTTSGNQVYPSTGGGGAPNVANFNAANVAQTSTETRPANKYVTPYIFTGAQTP